MYLIDCFIFLPALEVADPIQLEKRLNVIKLTADVTTKAERLSNYGAFAMNILKVDKALLKPSPNTPKSDDRVIWCEININYKGMGLKSFGIRSFIVLYKCL